MENEKKEVVEDAVIGYADAHIWFSQLMARKTEDLEQQMFDEEPALAAVAVHMAMETETAVRTISPAIAKAMHKKVLRSALITAFMTRQGYRKFMADLIDPTFGEDRHE